MSMSGRRYECASCQRLSQFDGFPCEGCAGEVWLPVEVSPCPAGVTASDWMSESTRMALCDSDDHQWRTGNHVRSLDG